jgi:hypothetical protein
MVGVWYTGKGTVDCVVEKLQALPLEEGVEKEDKNVDCPEADVDCAKVVSLPVEVPTVAVVDTEVELDFVDE